MTITATLGAHVRQSRLNLFSSMEKAVVGTGIGEKKLHLIETDKDPLSPETAYILKERLQDPLISRRFCNEMCPIGKEHPRAIDLMELPQIVLFLHKGNSDFKQLEDRLMAIACDGIVSDQEEAEFLYIMQELEFFSRSIDRLRLWCEKNLSKEITATAIAATQ